MWLGIDIYVFTVQMWLGVGRSIFLLFDRTGYDIIVVVAMDYDAVFPSGSVHVHFFFPFSPDAHS
jgi:hypothetical protein